MAKTQRIITVDDLKPTLFRLRYLVDPVEQKDIGWELLVDFTEIDPTGKEMQSTSTSFILDAAQAKEWEKLATGWTTQVKKERGLEDGTVSARRK